MRGAARAAAAPFDINALNEAGWKLLECAGPAIHPNRCRDIAIEVLTAYFNSIQRQERELTAAPNVAGHNGGQELPTSDSAVPSEVEWHPFAEAPADGRCVPPALNAAPQEPSHHDDMSAISESGSKNRAEPADAALTSSRAELAKQLRAIITFEERVQTTLFKAADALEGKKP